MNKYFKRNCLTVSVISAAMGLSGVSKAQIEASPVLEEVVVTGVRSALRESLSLKRDQIQFVDAVTADDIGKLPDSNVAESLARISGVQIDRGIGEGSDISIRGQRENVILYNGRQVYDSTGRGGNGLDQLGTSTYGLLTLVPSQLISQLQVTKLAGADDIEGGIGGIVNIISRKPLDKPGFQLAGSLTGAYEELASESGYEYFGLASNTFADDTIGVLLSVTGSERDLAEEGLNTFSGYGVIAENGAPLFDGNGNAVSDDPNGDGISALMHLDPRLQQISEVRERNGLSAIVQWQPNESVELVFDTFYSELESDRDRHWIGYFAGFGPHTNVRFSPNEILLSGTVTRPIQTNVEFADVESDILSSAFQVNWDINETVSLNTEIAASEANSTYDQVFFRLQSNEATDITYDLTDGDFGNYSFPADLTDASVLNHAILFDNYFEAETQSLDIRSDLEWRFEQGFFSSIEVGIRYQDIETDNEQVNIDIRPGIPAEDLGDFLEVFSNSGYLSGELPSIPRSYLSARESVVTGCEAFSEFYTPEQQATCDDKQNPSSANSLLNTYEIEEEFFSVYAKANFSTLVGGMELTGNFGIRQVDRDLTSTGNQLFDGVVTPNVFDRGDDEFLPSAVARLDVSDNLVVRAGAAKVIAFPNTADLNNGLQLFGDFRGSGGNPGLDPFLATQIDFSVEYYFAEESVLSLGFFAKDIDTFIVASTQQENVAGFERPFSISRKGNGDDADVKGLEVLYQQPFTGFLENFGTVVTYSYIDSETPLEDDSGRSLTLPGLSENNVNFIAYYENNRFSARLAYNWRDEYLQSIGPADTGVYVDGYEDLSVSLGWRFNENYAIKFEALNLLDSQLETYNAEQEALRTNVEYGPSYRLTFTARL